jgi:hypothetical protein
MRDAKIVQAEQDDRGRWLQAEVDPDLGESYARFASPWGVEAVNMIDRAASMEMGRWA